MNESEKEEDRLSSHGQLGEHFRRELTALFQQRSQQEWIEMLQSADVPCWPIYQPEAVVADPHLHARKMLQWLDDPTDGRVPQWGFPIKSSSMSPELKRPAPELGMHTEEVILESGVSAAQLKKLRESGAV